MKRIIIITARDGKKFEGTDYNELLTRVTEYEKELDKQEAERKARLEKIEAERKKKDQVKSTLKKEIDDLAALLTEKVKEYEKTTEEVMQYVNENGELKVKRHDVYVYKSKFTGVPLSWF